MIVTRKLKLFAFVHSQHPRDFRGKKVWYFFFSGLKTNTTNQLSCVCSLVCKNGTRLPSLCQQCFFPSPFLRSATHFDPCAHNMDDRAWEPHLEMNLPAEILNHILSFLQSDPVALRACCESHPSLSKLAEPYLYAHISLRTDDMFPEQNLGVFDLSKLLSNSPHLVHYIFSLHVVFVGYQPDVQVNRHVEEISAILPLLLALRTITLGRMSGSPGQLPESFTVVFLDCLLLPSMQKVRILNFDDIPLMEREPIRRSTVS